MSKTKKIIFIICCAILIFVTGFFAGRFIRFGRVSGTSEQLIDGIILERDTVNKLADELNIAGSSINSANDLERAVTKGVRVLRNANEVGSLFIDAFEQSVADNQKCTEELKQSYNNLSDATGYALDLAIIHAQEYERLIGTLQQIVDNYSKDAGESEPRS